MQLLPSVAGDGRVSSARAKLSLMTPVNLPRDVREAVAHGERVPVVADGNTVAVIVSPADVERLEEFEDLEAIRHANADGERGVPLDQVLANVGLTRADLSR